MSNIFERATKQALRFTTAKGQITVEDVWKLNLKSIGSKLDLDTLARHYYKLLKEEESMSFVDTAKSDPCRTHNQLCFDIVKHIIDVKKAATEKAEKAQQTRVLKEKIKEAIQDKEDSSLKSLSVDELKKLLDDLK